MRSGGAWRFVRPWLASVKGLSNILLLQCATEAFVGYYTPLEELGSCSARGDSVEPDRVIVVKLSWQILLRSRCT